MKRLYTRLQVIELVDHHGNIQYSENQRVFRLVLSNKPTTRRVHEAEKQKMNRVVPVMRSVILALIGGSQRSAQRDSADLAGIYRVRARHCRELSARVQNGPAASALLALAAEHEADAARLSCDGQGDQRFERGL